MEDWQEFAKCKNVDVEVFYPSTGETTDLAKSYCKLCTVKLECLKFALETSQRHGVWGGLSERKRRALRSAIRKGHIIEGLEDVVLPPVSVTLNHCGR